MYGFLVDVKDPQMTRVVEIEDSLETYYNLLNCDCIDIVVRTIGRKEFDIVCDDEGLFKQFPRVSAVDKDCQPMLVGNLLFLHHNEEGEMTGLSEDDVEHLIKHLVIVGDERGVYHAVREVAY